MQHGSPPCSRSWLSSTVPFSGQLSACDAGSLLGLAGRTIGAGAALSPEAYGVPGRTGGCASTATTHGDQDRSRLTAASGMACQLGGDDLPPADACDLLAVRWCTLRESPPGTRS